MVLVTGSRELATQAVVVVVITGSNFTTQCNAFVEVVLHAATDGGHRIPTVVLNGARVGRMTDGAKTTEHIRTPCRTLIAKEPATGHAKADAFPLMTRAERIVVEIRIVVRVFGINGKIRVDPPADAEAGIQRRIGVTIAVGKIHANARSQVPASILRIDRGNAAANHGHCDQCTQCLVFHHCRILIFV